MIHIYWLFCFPSTEAIEHFLVACQPNSPQHIIIVDSASEQIKCILDTTANSSNLIEYRYEEPTNINPSWVWVLYCTLLNFHVELLP